MWFFDLRQTLKLTDGEVWPADLDTGKCPCPSLGLWVPSSPCVMMTDPLLWVSHTHHFWHTHYLRCIQDSHCPHHLTLHVWHHRTHNSHHIHDLNTLRISISHKTPTCHYPHPPRSCIPAHCAPVYRCLRSIAVPKFTLLTVCSVLFPHLPRIGLFLNETLHYISGFRRSMDGTFSSSVPSSWVYTEHLHRSDSSWMLCINYVGE